MPSIRRAFAIAVATLLAIPALSLAAAAPADALASDITPPQIVEFDVSALSIDVSEAAQTITARARITDDQSGTITPTMVLSSEATSQGEGFGEMALVSGTALDGWYEWSVTVPAGAAPGAWNAVVFPLGDRQGNVGDFGPPASFMSTVNVVNPTGADVLAPQLVDFEFSPSAVDVSTSPQTVSVRARVTDDNSGTTIPTMTLASRVTDQTAGFGAMRLTSGTALDGWYEWSATIPVGAAPGLWDIRLFPLEDARGNIGAFGPPETFDHEIRVVNSSGSDVTAPVLVAFEASPRTLDISDAAQTLTVRAHVTDDVSGAESPILSLRHDATGQSVGFGSMALASGNALDGWYEWSATVPLGSATGTWELSLFPLTDLRGNSGSFGPPAQFDGNIEVVNYSSDLTAPQLVSFTVSPETYYPESDDVLTIRARVTDTGSGTRTPILMVETDPDNPEGSAGAAGPMTLVEGDRNDGIWETSSNYDSSFPGRMFASIASLEDGRGNTSTLSTNNRLMFTIADGTRPTAPDAPTAVSATGGDASAEVTWTAPASDGGTTISSYVVTAAPGGATVTVDDATTETTISGLTNGTAYTFTVVAVNAAGNSPASATSAAVTPRTVAGAPTAVAAAPADRSAAVTWTAPLSDGGAEITSYVVTATPGGHTVTVDADRTTATVTDLTNGTPYTFTVVAVNAAGSSLTSTASATLIPRTVPGAPSGVTATGGDAVATVNWAAPTNNGGNAVSSYSVTAAPGGKTVTVAASTTTATVTGLTNGTAYTFTVVAINEAGKSSPSEASVAVTPLEPLEPFVRSAGANRFATAAAIADQFPAGIDTAYIASGVNFPDALAGAALAGSQDVPVLLALRDSVPQATLDALERLRPQRIVILGGTPTISEAAATQLRAHGTVTRIAGANRFATAAAISEGFAPGADRVYIASGMNFPDALAGAALAGTTDSPVLLTVPSSLPDSVREAIERLNPNEIVILGGTPSVSASVETALRQYAPTTRLAGGNRYETAALVAAEFSEADRVFIASGLKFPDALAGAALAGSQGAPVLLTRPTLLPDATAAAAQRLHPQQVIVLGDANSINNTVADQLRAITQ